MYIGIDLGGTNIRVASMNDNCEILFQKIEKTKDNVYTSLDLYNKIVRMIREIPDYDKALSIAIAVPGSIKGNIVIKAENLSILENYPIVDKLRLEFNKNVYIENDGRIAAYGEALMGAGKNKDIVVYITISTGFGGGIIINKKIYTGSNNYGGYISNYKINGVIVDNLLSGTAISNKTQLDTIEAFKTNNSFLEEWKNNLLSFLYNISIIINPDIIILGGGVSKSYQYFLDDICESYRKEVPVLLKDTLITTCKLDEPGIIGACLYAKDKENDDA